jgi:hypothetical protein
MLTACSSAGTEQSASDRCIEASTVYSPPSTLGGTGSVQTVRRATPCDLSQDETIAEGTPGASMTLGGSSRADRILAFAQNSPPIDVSLILDDAEVPTVRLEVPAGYINPFIPGLFENIEDGEYEARGVRLYFLKQDGEIRPWIDVVDQHVTYEAWFTIFAVPDDHLSMMRSNYDDNRNPNSMFTRTGEHAFGLDQAIYNQSENSVLSVYLPAEVDESWFFIDCSTPNMGALLVDPQDGLCSLFLFVTDDVMTHGSFPYRDLENWRIYRDAYNRVFSELLIEG